jgi:hypothetical protein
VKTNVDLRTVNLSAYPELVVIYLGMRVRTFPGIKTLLGLGPQIGNAGAGRRTACCIMRTISSSGSTPCISGCAGTGAISLTRQVIFLFLLEQ